jgi:hypothetical protein
VRGAGAESRRAGRSIPDFSLRVEGKFSFEIKLILPVQTRLQKIFPFAPDPNQLHIENRLVPPKGAYRDRHGRGAGCGGRGGAV